MEIDWMSRIIVIVSQDRDLLGNALTILLFIIILFQLSPPPCFLISEETLQKRLQDSLRERDSQWMKHEKVPSFSPSVKTSTPSLSPPSPLSSSHAHSQCIHRKGMKPSSVCFFFFREWKVKGEWGGKGSFKCPLLFVLTVTQEQLERQKPEMRRSISGSNLFPSTRKWKYAERITFGNWEIDHKTQRWTHNQFEH